MPTKYTPFSLLLGHAPRLVLLLLCTALLRPAVAADRNSPQDPKAPSVERVSFTPRSDGLGYVIRVHTDARVPAFSTPEVDGKHLTLTLFNTKLAVPYTHDHPRGPIRDYEVVRDKDQLTIRFELVQTAVKVRAYRDRSSNDLLLGLTYGTSPEMPVTTVAATTATEGPSQGARERWRLDTIVIDAGHGGRDVGAVGHKGLYEKDVVLPVALKLGAYLEELLGVKVVYTRDDDRFIPLENRGQIANQSEGKLFISLHANSAANPAARGTETYFLGMHKTDAARTVMDRENSVIELENDPTAYSQFDRSALVRQVLAQGAFMRQSEQLAGLVEQQFGGRVNRHSRGIKQAGFYVLWGASMPALLVELGFVTNPREAAFLRSENGQTLMASAIFRAVRDFKEQYEKGLHLAAAQ